MSDTPPPLVSVLIPVYNGERFLAETLQSVFRQNWTPLEIIVVDDGSEDRSAEVAENFAPRVRCLRFPHRGLASARNAALKEASGEFILHLDADDLLTENSIALRMQVFMQDPELDMVIGYLKPFFSPEMDAAKRSAIILPPPQKGHVPGTSLIRTEVFQRLGGFCEDHQYLADMDWFMKALDRHARHRFLSDIVVHRRIHGKNMSLSTKQKVSHDRLRILKSSLERRRAAQEEAIT